MIPKEKIEEVRDRANIVSVISEYVPLKKRGHSHIGLCPFHSEKTPSFTVNEEKKIFYCFGCNATGNVITFLMKKEGMPFHEVVKDLAKRYGIAIAEAKAQNDSRDPIFRALRLSVEYFAKELNGPGGTAAREYLKKRGFLEPGILKQFGLGFATGQWEGLTGYLRENGIQMEWAERAGLVIKKSGGYYDRFRERVIFPITDLKGRIIGFGGRSLGNAMPKYLNSPESVVFKKNETLYGLFHAKKAIMDQEKAIVVEGYFDLLALHKNGFTNSVATMGTALTQGHIKTLKGYAGTVYALFDSDEAGKKAAIRGLNLFLEEEMPCRAVVLPHGKDPDEFLSASGPDAMKEALDKAEPLMEFFLKDLQKKTNPVTPEGKRKYLDNALGYLVKVKNVAERGHYAGFTAAVLGIQVEAVYGAIKSIDVGKGSIAVGARDAAAGEKASGTRDLKEMTVLRVILNHPELFSPEVSSAIEEFKDPVLKEACKAIGFFYSQGKPIDPPSLMELQDEGARRILGELLLKKQDDGFIEDPEKMLKDCLKRLLNRGKLKETTREIIRKLEETGRSDVALQIKKRIGTEGKNR